jgi:hypothetical protein
MAPDFRPLDDDPGDVAATAPPEPAAEERVARLGGRTLRQPTADVP